MAASIQRSVLLKKLLLNSSFRPALLSSRRSLETISNEDYHPAIAPGAAVKFARYGGRNTVTALTGDGVGPELLKYVQEIFRYSGAPVDFETVEISGSMDDPDVMRDALLSVGRNGVAIKGNIETVFDGSSARSMNVLIRTELKLFASIVRCKSLPGVATRHTGIDMVLIRENTEGEYSNLEHENVQGVVESLKIITKAKSSNIARYAFEYARKYGRKKVTAIHKANIMKLGDGLFLNCCREVSKDYPEIEFNDMIIDNASMQMVSRPQQFDVLVMPNLYGNILSNIAAGLVGGPGVVGGMNVGENYAVFEMGTRNSGKSLKGKNIANPVGVLLASCDMLDYLGHYRYATLIRQSVMCVLNEKKIHTPDLGGQATTQDVIQAVIDEIKPRTLAWCSCDNCQQMASQDECKCCRSMPNVMAKVEEFNMETDQQVRCILQHPGFSSVCLDRYVLETAYYQYRQQYGETHPVDDNKRKRYTAYRQLARWCWGYLGKEVRVVLPSCAVCKIRETFPSDDYEGFHYAG